jgi:hypothetical protein
MVEELNAIVVTKTNSPDVDVLNEEVALYHMRRHKYLGCRTTNLVADAISFICGHRTVPFTTSIFRLVTMEWILGYMR